MAAIDLFERWKGSEKNATDRTNEQNHVITSPVYENESLAIQLLYDKVHELTNKINAHINSIATNTAKTGITTSQANAITANTAKTSMTLGTTGSTALAGDTTTISGSQALAITANSKLGQRLKASKQASLTKSTTIEFGEFTTTGSGKTLAYSLPITVVETDTSGKSPVTITKTGSITLT